jgi:hypothetical protein
LTSDGPSARASEHDPTNESVTDEVDERAAGEPPDE